MSEKENGTFYMIAMTAFTVSQYPILMEILKGSSVIHTIIGVLIIRCVTVYSWFTEKLNHRESISILIMCVRLATNTSDRYTMFVSHSRIVSHVLLHAVSSHLVSIIAIPSMLACLLQTLRSFSEYRTH